MANSHYAENNPKHVEMAGDVAVTSTSDPASCGPGVGAGVAASVPSFAAALELLSAPYSCLVMNTHHRHIALPPVHLHKKRTGIRDELDAELLKFSPSLSGVPLAYDNIRIVGQQGDIFDDSGYIHLNIEANFIVFQPKKGQTLLGKVNKLGASHVGCLVHGCFNASIPKPNRVSMETWKDAGPQIGSELEFNVVALDADIAGVLLIRGQLNRTRVQELLAIGESMATDQSILQQPDEPDADQSLNQTTEPVEAPPEETPKKKKNKKRDKIKEESNFTPEKDRELDTTLENRTMNETVDESGSASTEKKKKKKKKHKIKEEEGEEPVSTPFTPEPDTTELNGTMDETNGNVEKKKKKKKDKRVKEEPEEMELSSVAAQFGGSDSSGYLSDKSSKKRKQEIQTESMLEFEMPCKKKIKTLIELKTEFEH